MADLECYTISTLDLISMDEIDLDLEVKKQIVKIITGWPQMMLIIDHMNGISAIVDMVD